MCVCVKERELHDSLSLAEPKVRSVTEQMEISEGV